jgi:hypothetical protein
MSRGELRLLRTRKQPTYRPRALNPEIRAEHRAVIHVHGLNRDAIARTEADLRASHFLLYASAHRSNTNGGDVMGQQGPSGGTGGEPYNNNNTRSLLRQLIVRHGDYIDQIQQHYESRSG